MAAQKVEKALEENMAATIIPPRTLYSRIYKVLFQQVLLTRPGKPF